MGLDMSLGAVPQPWPPAQRAKETAPPRRPRTLKPRKANGKGGPRGGNPPGVSGPRGGPEKRVFSSPIGVQITVCTAMAFIAVMMMPQVTGYF